MPEVLVESVTFLFTDIEGSTALWEADPETMRGALQRHNKLLSAAVENHGGYVFKTVGDAYCVTFDHAPDALAGNILLKKSNAVFMDRSESGRLCSRLYTSEKEITSVCGIPRDRCGLRSA